MTPRGRILGLAASAAALPVVSCRAAARACPARPVTMIVPASTSRAADQLTPEALAACQKAEIDKWRPIVKATGIKAE